LSIVDIILIVSIIFFAWLGYRRGFINSFFDLGRWVGAITLAALFYTSISDVLAQNFSIQEEWQKPLSFFITFITAFFLLSMFCILLKKVINPATQYTFTNKIMGLIPGFLTGITMAVILAKIFMASVWFSESRKQNSMVFAALDNATNGWFDNRMENVFNVPENIKISGALETPYSESAEFKSKSFYARPDLETQMLNLVNEERRSRGLQILQPDAKLKQAAQSHGTDMFTRGYFSHNTPEGIDPFKRMKKLGIRYSFAGENLAHSYDLDAAHTGLMNSPGHRANILNQHFGKIGIAILDGGSKGLMLVQEFSN